MEGNETPPDDHSNYYGSITMNETQIQNALEQLVTAMRNSEEYIRFKKAEAKVAEFSGLQQRIDEFRGSWYALQSSGATDLFEQIDRVEEAYMDFRENPYVQEFLASELALCRMFQKVNWTILQNLDFDTGFLQGN